MKLKPDEFWDMTLVEMFDILDALVFEEQRQDDMKNQRIAWQTSHIMNASGNYKKKISPTDLYKPKDDREKEEEQKIVKRFESQEQKDAYLERLIKKVRGE